MCFVLQYLTFTSALCGLGGSACGAPPAPLLLLPLVWSEVEREGGWEGGREGGREGEGERERGRARGRGREGEREGGGEREREMDE